MRRRVIVTGTAAAMVLTAGIVGAVAVQPGSDQDRGTTASPVVPYTLQGLPPMMVRREPTSRPGKNGTVDVRSNREPQGSLFKYTPKHMADSYTSQPGRAFTMTPPPTVDLGEGTWPSAPTVPADRPTGKPMTPPTQGPTTPPAQSPEPPAPTPTPTPAPEPEPEPEPTDPPSEDPSTEPTTDPSTEPTE